MLATVRVFLVGLAVCWSTAADAFDFIEWVKAKVAGLVGGAADAAKEKACSDMISPIIDTVKEKLEKQVKDKCKPLADKSDAAGTCCEKRGNEIATEPADNQEELLMTKCKEIESVTDVPSKMKQAIEEGKQTLQDDCDSVPDKLQGALETCVQEETDKATDTAVDETEEAVMGKDAKEDKDVAVEEKVEVNRLASAAREVPLLAVVALVCSSLVALTAVVMLQCRRFYTAAMEQETSSEVEVPFVAPE